MILAEGNVTDELLDFHMLGPITAHQFLLILCGVLMVGLFTWAAKKMPVTPKKTGLLALIEFGLVWVRDEVVYSWLGPEEGRRYLPLMWTIFFFVLFSNLFGLFPLSVVPHHRTDGLSVATGNLAVTSALAFIVFVVVLMAGMRKHGPLRYWGTLIPPGLPWPLKPFIFVLEFLGLVTRSVALAIRLFANMLAGHALLGILFSFVFGIFVFAHPWQAVMPTIGSTIFLIGIFLFEVLIALIQAYIFTILSVIFVSISVAEDH